jgi:hypothetical protein
VRPGIIPRPGGGPAGSHIARREFRRDFWVTERTFPELCAQYRGMLAGLLLAGGSILTLPEGFTVRIVNADPEIIGWLSGCGGHVYWAESDGRRRKPLGTWELRRQVDVFHCLSTVLPLLVGRKRDLAFEALRELRHRHGFRKSHGL